MTIIVLLSPIHFFPHFFLELSFMNLNPLYSQDNDCIPFQKTNKNTNK